MLFLSISEKHHTHVRKNFPAPGTNGIFIGFFTSTCQAACLAQPARNISRSSQAVAALTPDFLWSPREQAGHGGPGPAGAPSAHASSLRRQTVAAGVPGVWGSSLAAWRPGRTCRPWNWLLVPDGEASPCGLILVLNGEDAT